ncbi:VapE domain-containing protein [Asticcacaulis taihuensis]|uniref:Virulence-associated protein E n=1 Tax=Asticcacaulis taihuensis TaxID=260084 RepID=A0A1G4SVX6_9CAUL|nr:VapE domain-containing protein [Asticcacaulis taihuensis]SCW73320.1 Virulence-associated protein E [Asticcacaulis taihuensis]
MTDTEFKGNTNEALEFASLLHPNDIAHFVTIVPDGSITARSFAPTDLLAMRQFIDQRQGRENMYLHVNILKPGIRNRKAKKEDVASVRYLHVDIDDPEGLERIKNFPLPPTVVVLSGGGYNVYWRLKQETTDIAGVENRNRWLVERLDGDRAATDVSRILRLPGTINIPTKVKASKGRKRTLSRIVREYTDMSRAYDISEFGEVLEISPRHVVEKTNAVSVANSNLRPAEIRPGLASRIDQLIRKGDDPENPRNSAKPRYRSRSETVFAVTCALHRAGYSVEEVAGILLNSDYGISESILEKRNPHAEALRQTQKSLRAVSNDWPDGESHGIPKRTFQNTQVGIIRLRIRCSYNVFKNRMYVEGEALQSHHGEMTDKVCLLVRDLINKHFGFDPGSEMTRDAVYQLCNENAYDPLLDYLNSLVWDGIERIDRWLVDLAGAEDSQYIRAVGRIVLIAAVRRVRSPGVKFDTILVLEGPQGSGKSSAIKILAGEEYFSDQDLLALEPRAQMEALEGVWLYELGELAGMRHADVNKVKAFASRSIDRGRAAYGRFAEVRPRRVILIGTTNDDQYLKDETGNRRFWPVRTGDIDTELLSVTRNQLWAEAAFREANGESILLPIDLWDVAASEQGQRLEPDPWEDVVLSTEPDVFNGRELMSSVYLLENVLKISGAQLQKHHYRRLSKVMKALGWNGPTTITTEAGRKMKGYWRLTSRPNSPM